MIVWLTVIVIGFMSSFSPTPKHIETGIGAERNMKEKPHIIRLIHKGPDVDSLIDKKTITGKDIGDGR